MEYRHGAYGQLGESLLRTPAEGAIVPVYIGTAPVHRTGGAINEPVLLKTFGQAKAALGYDEDWGSYTLCEAMHAHFAGSAPVGPIVMINVFDPEAFKEEEDTTKTDVAGTIAGFVLADMEKAILSTLMVGAEAADVKYTVRYDGDTKKVRLEPKAGVTMPVKATIKYRELDTVTLTEASVIGVPSDKGESTGIYAVDKVYQATERVPYTLAAPGWSQIKGVREALVTASRKINGHWYAHVRCDLPITSAGVEVAIDEVKATKGTLGYTSGGECLHWPKAKQTRMERGQKVERVYHLSTLAIAQQMRLDMANGNVPFESLDNKPLDMDGIVLHGAKSGLYGPETLNHYLTQHGIDSALYWGGTWRSWGSHTAAVTDGETDDPAELYAANVRMLYYLVNWFQARFGDEIGKPYTKNRGQSIRAEVQAYLDALRGQGALVKGGCELDMGDDPMSDVMAGRIRFNIAVTNTPPLRSLEATMRFDETGLELIWAEEG